MSSNICREGILVARILNVIEGLLGNWADIVILHYRPRGTETPNPPVIFSSRDCARSVQQIVIGIVDTDSDGQVGDHLLRILL